MAIFYKHIKGCGASSTGQTGSTTDLWTWIKWADITNNAAITTATKDILPSIKINTTNTFDGEPNIDAGKIITSNASGQSIEQFFAFSAGAKIGFIDYFLQSTEKRGEAFQNSKDYTLETNADLWLSRTSLILADNGSVQGAVNNYDEPFANLFFITTEGGVLDKQNSNVLKVISNTSSKGNKQGQILFQAKRHTFDGHIWAQNSLYVGGGTDRTEDSSLEEGVIKATNKCEALYFNATSDRRAKENITPTTFSALSVVNSIPTYTFNYKSQPDTKVIGLMAQDAAEYNLDGFNIVDNLEATGECGDMMKMKESKLVYVLWKAVQELSAEVEDLKAQLTSLK